LALGYHRGEEEFIGVEGGAPALLSSGGMGRGQGWGEERGAQGGPFIGAWVRGGVGADGHWQGVQRQR
jgi:hypothetical protein